MKILRFIKKKIKALIQLRCDFKKFRLAKDIPVVHVDVSYTLPNERFVNRKILVSGGSSGIGLAIAKAFLAEGAQVIITGRNKERLESVIAEINSPNLFSLQWDIADVASIEKKLKDANQILSEIDIFINSAGISDYGGGRMMEEDTYDRIMNVNTKGLFYMCKAEGEYFIHNGTHGRIINITSKAGERISFNPYTLSKWGANSITKSTARWLANYHIAVNGIAPGRVPTNITKELQLHMNDDNQYTERHSTKRFTQPEEIAELALYLASGAAGNIIGQIINVDGGIYD